jgi:hypothetical protein
MNVGQVLETHLGVAAKALGFRVATPVFDGIKEKKIREYLEDAKEEGRFLPGCRLTVKRGFLMDEPAILSTRRWSLVHLYDEARSLGG